MSEFEQHQPQLDPAIAHEGWIKRHVKTILFTGALTVATSLAAGTLSACMEGVYGSDMPARVYGPENELDYIPNESAVTVLNWNTHQGKDAEGRAVLTQQIELVAQQEADIIALTEVREEDVEAFRENFPTSYIIYAPAGLDTDLQLRLPHLDPHDWSFAKDNSKAVGNLLIVNSELVDGRVTANSFVLSRPSTDFGKKIITEIVFGDMQVFLTHIDWSNQVDVEQAQEASGFVAAWRDFTKQTLLLGDFNDIVSSKVIKTFTRKTYLDPVSCGASTLVHYNAQIDYLFTSSSDDKQNSCIVIQSKRSDHLPQVYEISPLPPGIIHERQPQPA